MKFFTLLVLVFSLQACVENKTSQQSIKTKEFQVSGNLAGYSCLMSTNDGPAVKIFMNGISFEQRESLMRFFTLDNKNRIISKGVMVNGSEILEAYFDTTAFPDSSSIDSDAQTSVVEGSEYKEKSIVVRHWLKGNGLTQIISDNVVRNGEASLHSSKLEAEIDDCRPAIINEADEKISEF